ncbi:MAG: signal peptidase I [Clostridiaceae bacterium]|nr:signal peptidase I [Clostridiaceae bacterium]
MAHRFLPVKAFKGRCFLLLVGYFCLYLMDNLPIASFIGYNSYTYYIKPAIWILLVVLIWESPRIRSAAKLKLMDGIVLWAFCFAVIHILVSIGAGLIDDGFGKSPYDHSLKGMLKNLLFVGTTLAGRETLRAYIVNSMAGQRVKYLLFLLLSLFFTFCNYTLLSYARLKNIRDIVVFCAEFFVPDFPENLMATYLAYLGGSVPAITYTGILQAFHWFSPVLPNLKWIVAAFVGILCPIFSLLLMQNIYLKESRIYKRKEKDEGGIVSWMITCLVSICIIWFSVGVFPVYPSVIATGSMEPLINSGDVVLINKSIDRENMKIGDIIQFRRDEILISHRIVEIINDDMGKGYITKGDNNSGRDVNIVRADKIKGEIIKVIPKAGWLTLLIKGQSDTALYEVEF